jgi:GNAT superfamily N-acetyltransferase
MASIKRLIIRPATPEDVDVLVEFSMAMALETEGRRLNPERLRLGILAVFESAARGFYLVAELRDERRSTVIGQLLVTYEWSDWRNATFWWIQSLYVVPSHRRQGVYTRMHEFVLGQARARKDVCGVRLYVEEKNIIAQATYHRVGLARAPYCVFETDFILPKGEKAV